MEQDPKVDIPAWLEESPTRITDLPVQSNIQDLPFEKLTWENFERLCLRLIREEADVENCRRYGERGDNQEGIDIYAILKSSKKYHVYQCKREKAFSPTKIKNAVDKFLEGTWAKKTSAFILCTQESLKSKKRSDAIIAQTERLGQIGISFIPWDSEELSIKLKDHPKIVADFFNEHFAKDFCVGYQIEKSNDSINEAKCVEEYKKWIADRTSYFQLPGLPDKFSMETDWLSIEVCCLSGDTEPFDARLITELYTHCVIVGDSGSGKSTLIQRLANDLTNAGEKVLLVSLAKVLGLVKGGQTFDDAILKASIDCLSTDKNLLLSALESSTYLLADGLDECYTEYASVAEDLNKWANGHPTTNIIISSRFSHERDQLSHWNHVRIQPLNREKNKGILEKSLGSNSLIKRNINEALIAIERVGFLEASPLLLGFTIYLIIEDKNIDHKNLAEIYEAVIDLAYNHPHKARENNALQLNRQSAKRILKIAGWKLINDSFINKDKLIELISQELQSIEYTIPKSEEEADIGIRFWESKCILNQSIYTGKNVASFIHLSMCEFAAGKYISELTEDDCKNWIKYSFKDLCVFSSPITSESIAKIDLENRFMIFPPKSNKWLKPMKFACGLGSGERILQYLLELSDCISSSLIIDVINDTKKISSSILDKILDQIRPELESSSPEIIFNATKILLSILPKYSDFVFDKHLLTHEKYWTRLAAIRIYLAWNEDNIDIEFLTESIRKISANLDDSDDELFSLSIKNQIISLGCTLLLKKNPCIDTAEDVLNFISNKSIKAGTQKLIKRKVLDLSRDKISTSINSEEKMKWLSFSWRISGAGKFLKNMTLPSFWHKQIQDIENREKFNYAHKVFLETISKIIDAKDENTSQETSSVNLTAVGSLFRGIGGWETGVNQWNILSESIDSEAVETVLKCMIRILDINQEKLAIELVHEMKHLDDFFSLDINSIKSVLKTNEFTSEYQQAIMQLMDLWQDKSFSYFDFPIVPVVYKWGKAVEIQVCPKVLVRAFQHPSRLISWTAIMLVKHGVGGQEALDLAKEFAGGNKWNSSEWDGWY